AAQKPSRSKIRIEDESLVDEGGSIFNLPHHECKCEPAHVESDRLLLAQLCRLPSQPGSFGDLRCSVHHPSIQFSPSITPRGHAIRRSKIWVEFDRFVEQPKRIVIGMPGCLISLRGSL